MNELYSYEADLQHKRPVIPRQTTYRHGKECSNEGEKHKRDRSQLANIHPRRRIRRVILRMGEVVDHAETTSDEDAECQ
jgi:hypothetical protein